MAKYITISVPQPCSEDWSRMTPAEKGRFCDACKKTVTDFTLMSDAQLAAFYKINNGKFCGRFRQDQLDKDLLIPGRQIPWLKYFFTISIPAFLVSLKASAQQQVGYEQTSGTTDKSASEISSYTTRIITGKVFDEKGRPLEAASVVIPNSKKGTRTDLNGEYRLSVRSTDKSVIISHIGSTPKTYNIDDSTKVLDCVLPVSENISMGEPVVITVAGGAYSNYSRRSKKKQKPNIQLYKETKSFTIFPNPSAANDRLHIKWNVKTTADQQAEIFAADGTLVQTETITPSSSKSPTAFIVLKNLVKGFYIIRITDLQTHEKLSKEFLIQ